MRNKISKIRNAIELIREAQNLIDEAVEGTSIKRRYEAYGKFGFCQLLGKGNPHDESIFDIINELKEAKENGN